MANATQNQTTDNSAATSTVDVTAKSAEATAEAPEATTEAPEAPAKVAEAPELGEFAGFLKTAEGLQLIEQLKGLSESEATKRIDKMSAGEALTLAQLVLSADIRKVLAKKLGESIAKQLVHTVCTKVQLATYEADDTARVQSLKDGDEGWGVYAQQAPLGGFGAEIGFVRQENKDGKFTTQRGAVGFYLRASDETRPSKTENDKAGADALAALLG